MEEGVKSVTLCDDKSDDEHKVKGNSVPSAGGGSCRQAEPEGSSSSSSRWLPEHHRLPTYQSDEESSSELAPDESKGRKVRTGTRPKILTLTGSEHSV